MHKIWQTWKFQHQNKYILESVQQHAMGPELTIKIIQICNIMFTLKMRPLAQALEAFNYQPAKQQISICSRT